MHGVNRTEFIGLTYYNIANSIGNTVTMTCIFNSAQSSSTNF